MLRNSMTHTCLTLLCLAEGEATPFPVEIESINTIGDLKHAIKRKNTASFSDIDAYMLTLWQVSIPVMPLDEHKKIFLMDVPSTKMLDETDSVSDALDVQPANKTIHIIVQRPPPHSVHARSSTPFSDGTITNNTAVPVPQDHGVFESTAWLVFIMRNLLSDRSGAAASMRFSSASAYFHSEWIQSIRDNPLEEEYLCNLVHRIVKTFAQQTVLDSDSIREIILVAPILDKVLYSHLVRIFYQQFQRSTPLDYNILLGLVQLIRDAPESSLEPDDYIRLLRSVRRHLEETFRKDTENTIYLTLAATVLLSTVPTNLNIDQEYRLQRKIFSALQRHKEPLIKFQAKYASQILRSTFRKDVVSGPDIFNGLRGILELMKEAIGFSGRKRWFQDVLTAEGYVRDRLFADMKRLVCVGPSAGDVNFQWRTCQLLGEIAVNPGWDDDARDHAFAILRGFVETSEGTKRDPRIKRWVLTILGYMSQSPVSPNLDGFFDMPTVADESRNDNAQKLAQELERSGVKPFNLTYPVIGSLPSPTTFPLLHKVNLDPDVEFAIDFLRRQRSREFDRRAVYIQLLSKQTLRSSEDILVALQERANSFLDSNKEVLLVLGDSGSGKSTFGLYLENKLWTEYKSGGRIPLFIDLKTIDASDKDMIRQHLEGQGFFSDQQIVELQGTRQFILICDGYDEYNQRTNLHTNNRFNKPRQWQAKMIVSCRTQYLGPNYRYYFEPETATNNNPNFSHTSNLFEEAVIVPFRAAQIEEYVSLFTQTFNSLDRLGGTEPWTMKQYMERLGSIAHLMDLAQNPFMLRMIMDVLPRIAQTTTKMTRVELYDNFVELHFESEQRRLLKQYSSGKMDSGTLSAFSLLKNDELVNFGLDFSKELSLSIFKEQAGGNTVTYTAVLDKGSWKEKFFGSDVTARLLRDSAQLVCRENRQDVRQLIRHRTRPAHRRNSYEFIHRSILEYFYSCLIFDPRGNKPSLDLAACLDPCGNAEPIAKHPLGQISIVSEASIIHFLVERIHATNDFRNQLNAIVEMSKVEVTVRQAASNSITILVKAGVQFNGTDLRGIQVPGADLSEGHFDPAQLQGADLTGVHLNRAWLREANLSETTMTDVLFGENPYFKVPALWSSAISSDGKMLVAGLGGGSVQIFDIVDFYRRLTFQGHSGIVRCVAISNDASLVASGGDDRSVRIWYLEGGKECVLRGHPTGVHSIAFSPDGTRVLSFGEDKIIWVWNIESQSCVRTMDTESTYLVSAWSPCGRQIATGSELNGLKLWDAETGELERILDTSMVSSIVYSRQGKILAVAGIGKVFVWDPANGSKGRNLTISGTQPLFGATFSRDDHTIAISYSNGSIQLWDASSGFFITSLNGHFNLIRDMMFRDNQELVSVSMEGTVRFWQLEGEMSLKGGFFKDPSPSRRGHRNDICSLVYSPIGDCVLSAGAYDQRIIRWDVETGDSDTLLKVSTHHKEIAISPDGRQLAMTDDGLHVYHLGESGESKKVLISGKSGAVSYSPRGRWFASGDHNGTIRLWDLQSGEEPRVLEGHFERIEQLTFSPNDCQLVSLCRAKLIGVWDTERAECTDILEPLGSGISFSPCGRMIAIAEDSSISVWDLQEKEMFSLKGFNDYARCVAWSPCDTWVAAVCSNRTLKLWMITNKEPRHAGSPVTVNLDFLGGVTSIVWIPTKPLEFATGCGCGSVFAWKIVQVSVGFQIQSVWNSVDSRLIASGTRIGQSIGLTDRQVDLLKQLGAIDESRISETENLVDIPNPRDL